MQNTFFIEVTEEGETVVLSLHGELDVATVGQLEPRLAMALSGGPQSLVIDLQDVGFMDSSGLRAVLLADQRARESGCEFVLVQGPEQVQRLFSLTLVSERMRIVDTLDEALRAA